MKKALTLEKVRTNIQDLKVTSNFDVQAEQAGRFFLETFIKSHQKYALSTEWCMLGNQDRHLARVVLFLLCSPIPSPLEVVSRKVFDEFTQLNKGRNFCHIFSILLGTCS